MVGVYSLLLNRYRWNRDDLPTAKSPSRTPFRRMLRPGSGGCAGGESDLQWLVVAVAVLLEDAGCAVDMKGLLVLSRINGY
jgi:hypothetical protein